MHLLVGGLGMHLVRQACFGKFFFRVTNYRWKCFKKDTNEDYVQCVFKWMINHLEIYI